MEIDNKLTALMSRVLCVELSKIGPETSQDNTAEWDSMNHLLLITEIEKEFGVSIPIEKSIELHSFADIRKFIQSSSHEKN